MKLENKKAFLWSATNNLSKLFFSFLTPIILARILGPEAFGLIALALILVGLSQIFIDFGTTEAIIKSRNISSKFLSSLFFFNLSICIFIYILILLLTPLVSNYFNKEELNIIIPLLSIGIFFQFIGIIPSSLFKREKNFLALTKADFLSRLISSIVAIIYSLYHADVYALVILSLSQSILYGIFLILFSTWRIKLYFSFSHIKMVFSFTASLFFIKIVNHIERQSDRVFIGPIYGDLLLGVFTRGLALQKAIQRFINGFFNPVFFSILTRENSLETIRNSLKQTYEAFLLMMFPLFLLFSFFSEELVLLIFGNQWEEMIPLLPLFAFLFLIRPFQKINQEIIKAKGNIFFLVACFSLYTPILISIYYFYADQFGLAGYIYAYIFISFLFLISSFIYICKLLDIKISFLIDLFRVFLPRAFLCFLIAYILNMVSFLQGLYFIKLSLFCVLLLLSLLLMQVLHYSSVQKSIQEAILGSIK